MLAHYLNYPEVWAHLAPEARAYAEEWSDTAMATRLAALYRQLAAAARPGYAGALNLI